MHACSMNITYLQDIDYSCSYIIYRLSKLNFGIGNTLYYNYLDNVVIHDCSNYPVRACAAGVE